MRTVVVATHNHKKSTELQRVIAAEGLQAEVLGLDELPAYPEPAETETSFEGNALIKARAAAGITGYLAVADDSGLAVDLLNGMPGVRSARWSGPDASDADNLNLLLRQLADTDEEQRTARFVCAMALVAPDGREWVVRGEMLGRLVLQPRGSNGFGYDPMFVANGQSRTNAELTPAEKDAISHRGKAVRSMLPLLREVLRETAG
ncbi:MAG: RdgB/HAM1 family non-canonical purine NTP pyrophosphatase [Propionicimonas sp.]|uniref:RdgB/HAM1 family non-canonical purine NTP pyrophosphatase n=1 Tax=Propionicimonas sp. TaxID=1955623 RepID=UPI002B1EB31A|nr:RdgB/HAM1 family non-canonical purine NTP pyrophosphatase [Propionicimonas sp.]MEA4943632.1 RdgB/HAM1 family non-canonical purine NTP pyrophosphatase [Propionicimonas sp.]MEA5054066.1 RdgB/HAM1 family non-canonical purine NTP pyrophosphatase [Propionicimonas sp.]MEA5117618.1 RdgB/HAM1 family non-canonical purine NTP pyrophosphatase [Propionicimonas sp.]